MYRIVSKFRFGQLRPYRRSLIAVVALLGYVASTIGFPIVDRVQNDGTQRSFFCEGSACGCQSAEHCWNNCCCSTLTQRIAWAAEHDIAVPEFVEHTNTNRSHVLATERPQHVVLSDHLPECSGSAGSSCCELNDSPSVTKVDSCESGGSCCSERPATRSQDKPSVRWVFGLQAQRCRGLGSYTMSWGEPITLPPKRVVCEIDAFLSGMVPEWTVHASQPIQSPIARPG